MPRALQLGIIATGLVRGMGGYSSTSRPHGGQTTQPLAPIPRALTCQKLHAQFFGSIACAVSPQFVHIQRFHQRFFGQQHGFFWSTPMPTPRCLADTNPRP